MADELKPFCSTLHGTRPYESDMIHVPRRPKELADISQSIHRLRNELTALDERLKELEKA